MLFKSLDHFYGTKSNFDALLKLISRKSTKGVSLRLITYFFGKYSANHAIMVAVDDSMRSLHDIYQSRLSTNGKAMFDAFKRSGTIVFTKHNTTINTTIAQLAFFRDVIQFNLISLIRACLPAVKAEMAADKKSASGTQSVRRPQAGIYISNVPTKIKIA